MISHKTHQLTLSYSEVCILEDYLQETGSNLKQKTAGASFSACAHGITISFATERSRNNVRDYMDLADKQETE